VLGSHTSAQVRKVSRLCLCHLGQCLAASVDFGLVFVKGVGGRNHRGLEVSRRRILSLRKTKGQEMGKVIVMNAVTLDGVMQGPGRADEDTRDGFAHGGWAVPYSDEAMVAKMGERMGADRAFLFGRRTYEQLLASWNAQGGPFKDALNNASKYVASGNPATRLDWPNSTLLRGDIPAAVADLKQSSSANLVIMGSGVLIGSLMDADLIDEYLLMIAPLVLGAGRRLFPGGTQASLRLADSMTTSTGVLIATYEPARG
jgi:dihydrofolate reductase